MSHGSNAFEMKILCNLNKIFFSLEGQWIIQTFHETKRRNPIWRWTSFSMWGWYTLDVSSLAPSCWKMVTTIMFWKVWTIHSFESKTKILQENKYFVLWRKKIVSYSFTINNWKIIEQNFGNPYDFECPSGCEDGIR